MNQRTHAWLAVRAVALLEEDGSVPNLVKILKPYIKSTAIGAWLPDLAGSKKGFGDIDYHILKMKPYSGSDSKRFITLKDDLLKRIGSKRKMHQYLKKDKTLTKTWWKTPYKANPNPGQHLANESMSLSSMLIDLLIFGDKDVAKLVPGSVPFVKQLNQDARSRKEQVATIFFMLSHFLADSCMPCHCDARSLSSYRGGLHHELESRWSRKVGTYFDKKKLAKSNSTSYRILKEAKAVDKSFGISFSGEVPKLKKKTDVWLEIINVCRASFALACIYSPVKDYPFGTTNKAPLKRFKKIDGGDKFLDDLDKVIIHDAILNIAIIWKHIWEKF